LPSPGLTARHYAPRTPVELHGSAAGAETRARDLRGIGKRVAVVLIGGSSGRDGVAMPVDAVGYAARLYDVLHDLDARGFDQILVELPPDTDDWLAVRDRLTRAAAR
ncbi:MAG: threonylcarbamoyl-AMP synthase, partial [Zavarzinella sp.]|nr:threonylcarbamoyl-AMP synthase [Zavarzinella sp.]